ncbi:MAG: hypothetical protein IPN76_12300 [Saprospiraceae bacterium]|nr:hypothetical protein [Saprospiraceae bacterium]
MDIAWVEIGHTHFKMLIRVDEVDMVDEFIWLIINPYQPHQLYQPKRKARLRIAQAGFDAFLRWQRKSLLALRNTSFVSAAAHGSVTTTATTHGIFHKKRISLAGYEPWFLKPSKPTDLIDISPNKKAFPVRNPERLF